MTISNLKAADDGTVTFSGTVDLSGEAVVFEAGIDPLLLAHLIRLARRRESLVAHDGPVKVRVTGLWGGRG